MKQSDSRSGGIINHCIFYLIGITFFTLSGCKTVKVASSKSMFETFAVFEPIPGQYASMRIPALVVTKKGTLLAFCEGRITSASDWADMNLLMRRSIDGGKTWEPAVVIASRQGNKPVSNPTPIVDRDGTVHLLFQRGYEAAYHIKSSDDGKNWTAPTDITYAFEAFKPEFNWHALAPGPGHSIQLKSGRLLVPVWIAVTQGINPKTKKRKHHPYRVGTIYSDDLGKTWKRGALIPESPEIHDPSETMAVELQDGRVMLSIRHGKKKERGISFSTDGISGWSMPTTDEELFDTGCMASIIRIPGPKGEKNGPLLFVNPDSRDIPKNPRANLTAKLSYDEGGNWTVQKVLNSGPSGYSDLAVGPDGTIYCLFETNTTSTGWNYSLVLKRFNLPWLTDGSQKQTDK
jgi:sialidase-1